MRANSNIVSVIRTNSQDYPSAPFSPPLRYPEFADFQLLQLNYDDQNDIYDGVRKNFIDLEFDKENIGKPQWNPLAELIKPGQSTVIKPNLVRHAHPLGREGVISMITHASVIRPIIDYVLLATGGNGTITICDVPLQQTEWEIMIKINGLSDLVDFYQQHNISVNLLDLRYEISHTNAEGIIISRDRRFRDPLGYTAVDLAEKSALMPIIKHYKKFEITDYGSGTVPQHHNPKKNEYFIPNTVLNADLFINVPKLKTHRKTGMTFALKNLVGINGDKSWLAHHRRGAPQSGGDEYEIFHLKSWLKWHIWAVLKKFRLGILLASAIKKFYRKYIWGGKDLDEIKMEGRKGNGITEGSWWGNDTIWRCILDFNRIIFFADKNGRLQQKPQRHYLCIGDGIIGGDKEGPMEQSPRPEGILIGGANPVAVDYVAAHVMGFDPEKIPQISQGFENKHWELVPFKRENIIWKSNITDVQNLNLHFVPTVNWQGHIERE